MKKKLFYLLLLFASMHLYAQNDTHEVIVSMESAKKEIMFHLTPTEELSIDWGDGSNKLTLAPPKPSSISNIIVALHDYKKAKPRIIQIKGSTKGLQSLIVAGIKLTSIEVSKNVELQTLTAYDNQLTSIDLLNNTELKDLSLAINQLSNIDISKNTMLEELDLSVNQLTSIDVSNNTALNRLDISNNKITTLDISKNKALTKLYISGNPLETDAAALIELVNSLPDLTNKKSGSLYLKASNPQARAIAESKNWTCR